MGCHSYGCRSDVRHVLDWSTEAVICGEKALVFCPPVLCFSYVHRSGQATAVTSDGTPREKYASGREEQPIPFCMVHVVARGIAGALLYESAKVEKAVEVRELAENLELERAVEEVTEFQESDGYWQVWSYIRDQIHLCSKS
jgi:hypothetical protein